MADFALRQFIPLSFVISALAIGALPHSAHAATITWSGLGTTLLCGAGNESDVTCQYNWVGNSAPGPNDLVVFDVTSVLPATIDQNWDVGGIELAALYTGTITQTSGATITIGSLHYTQAGGTFAGGNSAIDVNGNFSISGGTFTNTSGSLTVSGNYAKTGGTFTSGTTAVTFDGSGTQTMNTGGTDTGSDFQNLTKSNSGTLQLVTNALDVDETLTIASSTTLDSNGKNITAATLSNSGTLQLQGGETVSITTMDTDSGLVTYVGTGTYTQLAAGDAYYNLTLNGSGGSFTMDAALDVNGSLTITAGTLATGNNAITLAGDWSNSGTFTEGTGTVTFDGSVAQALNGETFYNLTINNSAATPSDSVDVDSSAAVTVSNTLTISDGQFSPTTASDFKDISITTNGILNPDISASITVSGNFTNSGTFTANSGTVSLTGTGTQTITSGGTSFYNLTQNGSGGTYTPQDATTVSNNLTITAGTLTLAGSAFTVSGTTSVTGTINTATSSTGTKTFTGAVTVNSGGTFDLSSQNPVVAFGAGITQSSSTAINAGSSNSNSLVGNLAGAGSGGITFGGNLTISSGTTTNSYTGGVVTVAGTLTLTGNFAQANGSSLTLSGTTPFSGAGTFSASTATNTVTYSASGAQTVKDPDGGTAHAYSNLALSGSGAKTMTAITTTNNFSVAGSATTSGNVLTTVAGTLTLSGTSTMTLGANLAVTGTITIGSGTTLDVSASNYTLSTAEDWSNSGTFTEQSGTVTFNGSVAQALTGETFYNLTINNSAASPSDTVDVDSSAAVIVTNTLTISDGQFSPTTASDFSAVTISTNGILKPDASASITVSGDWSNTGTFTHNSGTVTFDGTTQALSGSTTFYNFTKTEGANDSTDETLTFTAGTTQTVTNTWTLDGRDANDMINLVSSSPGTAWNINPQGTRTLDFIEVTDSTNANATLISCSSSCTGISGNTNWQFDFTAPTLSSFTSTTSNGTYGPTSTINITATYGESLSAGSTLTTTLNNGASVVLSTVSGVTVSGTYTVGATGSSEDTSDLTVSSISTESVLDALSNTRINSSVPSSPNNIADTSAIVIDTTAPSAPSPSTAGGSFSSSQSISLASTGGTVYYTLTGATPTTSSTLYTSAISISSTTTLKAINVDSVNNTSAVMTELYTISSGDTVTSTQSSSTGSSSAGVGPLYSQDGSDNAPIALDGTTKKIVHGIMQNVIDTISNKPITFSVRPIDADQLHSLRLRIGGRYFTLKKYKNSPVYNTPVRLIGVLGTGIHNYALTADYGITTRTAHGVVSVHENLTPYVDELFQKAYGRVPTKSERKYWSSRTAKGDKKTKKELFGAMSWHKEHRKANAL